MTNINKVFTYSDIESDSLKHAIEKRKGFIVVSDYMPGKLTPTIVERFQVICRHRIDHNMIHYVRKDLRKILGFGFTGKDYPNAYASLDFGLYSIVIHSGIIPLVYDFCHTMLKNGLINESVSDVSIPTRQTVIHLNKHDIWDALEKPEFENPLDNFMLWECIRYIMEFIVDHEFAHVFRGHIDLLNKNKAEILDESFFSCSQNRSEARLRQAMEIDADDFASKVCVATFFHRIAQANLSFPFGGVSERKAYSNRKHMFRFVTLCCYVGFRLFSKHENEVKNLYLRNHPPSTIRFIRQMQNFDNFLSMSNIPNKDYKVYILPQFFEVVYCGVTGSIYDKDRMDYFASRDGLRFALKLLKDLVKLSKNFSDPLSN